MCSTAKHIKEEPKSYSLSHSSNIWSRDHETAWHNKVRTKKKLHILLPSRGEPSFPMQSRFCTVSNSALQPSTSKYSNEGGTSGTGSDLGQAASESKYTDACWQTGNDSKLSAFHILRYALPLPVVHQIHVWRRRTHNMQSLQDQRCIF